MKKFYAVLAIPTSINYGVIFSDIYVKYILKKNSIHKKDSLINVIRYFKYSFITIVRIIII